MRKIEAWRPVIDKVQSKLSQWRADTFNRAGKLVLIKAVLSSLPMYYLSLFKIPKTVANKLIEIQRKFLWNRGKEKSSAPLVKWDKIQLPKTLGGLGVGDIILKNAGLLFKWWWRFSEEKETLWCRVVSAIHNENLNLFFPRGRNIRVGGTWAEILRLGLGEKPEAKIFSKFDGSTWRWLLVWESTPTEAHAVKIAQLESLLLSANLDTSKVDALKWRDENRGSYSVASYYNKAVVEKACKVGVDKLAEHVWMNLAPPKIEFMVWVAMQGRMNTRSRLFLRNIIGVDEIWCELCGKAPETIEHVLLHCEETWQIWTSLSYCWGMELVFPRTVRDLFQMWTECYKSGSFEYKVWVSIFFAVIWSIWNARNESIFEDVPFIRAQVLENIKFRVACWINLWQDNFMYSPSEVVRCFDCVQLLGR